jgi:hypothetical protein
MSDPVNSINLSQQQLDTFKAEGYLLIEDIVKKEFLDPIRNDILDIVTKLGLQENCPLKQTRKYVEGTTLDSYVNSKNLFAVTSQLLDSNANLYLPFTAVKTSGDDSLFNFHQDNNYTPHRGPSINMWVAFEDMSIENGCLYVDPKTHLKGTLESEVVEWGGRTDKKVIKTFNPTPVIVKAGTCVAFDRNLIHGSGSNTSNQHRVAYAMQFVGDQTEAFFDDHWSLLSERTRWEEEKVATLQEV